MHNFWQKILQPIFLGAKPNRIIEIGSATGENTKNLLQFCKENGSKLTSIDPAPQFDVNTWVNNHPGYFEVLQELSLAALPKIEEYDIVLIDGDHNWYTVYNELKLIEKHAITRGDFPLIFLHDVSWPYGRRDMYYSPETIPAESRQPYARKGIMPGYSHLIDGGSNSHLFNALHENGPRNGVLTAIEDFLRETSLPYNFHSINGNFGLGIITPNDIHLSNNIKHVLSYSGMK